MQIDNRINDEIITDAVSLMIHHCTDIGFLQRIVPITFNYEPMNGKMLAHSIANRLVDLKITLKPYRPFSPWSKVVAYASGNTIYFNIRKQMPLKDRVETIMHESLHLCGFKHKGNRADEYNLKTVPYLAAKIFSEYVMELKEKAA